jgi:hypothetical protein
MSTDSELRDAAVSRSAVREPFSLGTVISRHKRASAGAIALVLVLVASTIVPAFLSSSPEAVSDSTTCSQWSSASPAQMNAYSRLYLSEHSALSSGASSASSIRSAISSACVRAAYLGEADDVSVAAAIKHEY